MKGNFLDYPKYLAPIGKDDEADDNFEVLASKEQLKIIAKKMSEKWRHPITIIDAQRIKMNNYPSEIRVNSEAEFFSLRNSCRLFRHFVGYDKCYDCDHANALNFMENLKIHEESPDFSKTESNHIIIKQEDKNALGLFGVRGFQRLLYEYRCPMLGYRELLIPIYFPPKSDEILGILIIGQSVIEFEHDADYIKETKKSFFAKNKSADLFKTELGSDSIEEWIIGIDERLFPFEKLLGSPTKNENKDSEETTMSFSDMNEYIKFIRGACEYLHKIENELLKLYEEKRKEYFHKISVDVVDRFFVKIRNNVSKKQESYYELQNAWNNLLKATDELKLENTFNIKEIYVFGDGTSLTMTENQKKPLYSPDSKSTSDWYYDFSVVDSIDMPNIQFESSLKNKKIIKGLQADIDKENCFIILFSDIALVFCVKDLKKYEDIYRVLAEEIGKQFSRIHSSIALTTADFMQEKQVKTLRMNRHENAHISERINDLMNQYFYDNGKAFSDIGDNQKAYVVDNLKDSSRLLSDMAENIGVIIGSITKENIHDKVGYSDIDYILNKWKKMFRDKLNARTLDMKVNRSLWASNNIKTVPTLFELMIYNIVDNAVKYAYRGTNIYLKWDKTFDGYIFTAINYGPEIKDEERIYDLYVRGKATDSSQQIEGDGIGLYSVEKICELLGCKVGHTCDFISNHHLPLIEWYRTLFGANDRKSQELFDYKLNFDEKIWRDVVNIEEIPRDQISKMYLNSRIDRPIYKTVFTVKVPDEIKFEGDN